VSNIEFKIPALPGEFAAKSENPLREARELLEQAESLRQQRKFDRAESICTSLVRRYPEYFGALHTLGVILADKGDHRRAVGYLAQAAMFNPRSWFTLTALAGVYLHLRATEMAARTLEQALALKPTEPSILVTLGEIYQQDREYELARDAFRKALEAEPGMEEATYGLALACAALGAPAEAMEALEILLKRGVRSLAVLTALVRMPMSIIRRDVLADLDQVVRRADEDKTKFKIDTAFVRAAALDKAGRHAEAWTQALEANRPVAAQMKKELANNAIERKARLKGLQASSVKAKSPAAGDEKWPISLFILGPSRSGKTTMEALASTLDGVRRGYENPSVDHAISRTYQAAGLITLTSIHYLPPQLYPEVREIYLEELARRAGPSRVFTNTHPDYLADAALFPVILPNVRFIFVKRNPDDVLLRIFMRQYKAGNAYSYDLKAAREYIEWYYKMIDLLAGKLPDITRVIQYEDMVADPAGALGIAADLCGLPLNHGPLPEIGDDRGCAEPYREFMDAALKD
jgi:tetratricopeptide (TPR) repeat protein